MRINGVQSLIRATVLIVGAFLFQECRQKSPLELEVEKLMNSQLNIPQKMRDQLAEDSQYAKFADTKGGLAILTVINGNCASCIENLGKWRQLMSEREFSPGYIKYYFLVESEDDFIGFNYIDEKNDLIDYPLILDQKSLFFKSMNLSLNATLQTFLLDSNNKILMIGDPAHHPTIKELYKNEIHERLNL